MQEHAHLAVSSQIEFQSGAVTQRRAGMERDGLIDGSLDLFIDVDAAVLFTER